jgi:hypothetical protein
MEMTCFEECRPSLTELVAHWQRRDRRCCAQSRCGLEQLDLVVWYVLSDLAAKLTLL